MQRSLKKESSCTRISVHDNKVHACMEGDQNSLK